VRQYLPSHLLSQPVVTSPSPQPRRFQFIRRVMLDSLTKLVMERTCGIIVKTTVCETD
jgi:hypothetical protein